MVSKKWEIEMIVIRDVLRLASENRNSRCLIQVNYQR